MSVNTISIVRAVILFASAKNLDCSSGDENMKTVAATLEANQCVVGSVMVSLKLELKILFPGC